MTLTTTKYFGPSAAINVTETGTVLTIKLDELVSKEKIKNFVPMELTAATVNNPYFGITIIKQLCLFWAENQGAKVAGKAMTIEGPATTPVVEDMGNNIRMMFDSLGISITFKQEIDYPFDLNNSVMLKNGKGEEE